MTFTAWVALACIPLWALAIWLKRRRIARETAMDAKAREAVARYHPPTVEELRRKGAL